MNAFTCSSPLRSCRWTIALLLLLSATAAPAATFTVTNANASGAGSLAQAITDANATAPGPNTINFNIAGTGVKTITGTLPVVTRAVTINGYSQLGSAANTSATSDNAVLLIQLSACDLTLQGGGSTVKGLVINGGTNGITISSPSGATTAEPGNTVAGNFIGLNPAGTAAVPCATDGILIADTSKTSANIVGGTAPADRNVISGNTQSGIEVFGVNNQIYGNFIGLNAAGTAAVANGTSTSNFNSSGILIQGRCTACSPAQLGYASGTIIGGPATGARNVISGNDSGGVGVGILKSGVGDPAGTANTVIQGNYIGVNPTNTVNIPNYISILGFNFTLGGTTAGAGNVIAGTGRVQVSAVLGNNISSFAISNHTVFGGHTAGAGNLIGSLLVVPSSKNTFTAGTGVVVEGNQVTGNVSIGYDPAIVPGYHPVSGVTIGGTTPGAGNTIGGGIIVNDIGTANVFLSNSIGTTIDLAPSGPTANDPGDADTGANNLQNFPVIKTANSAGGSTTVSGSLNSTASSSFTLQFFSSPAADPSGHGPGKTVLGTITVNTDANGNADFSTSFGVALAAGQVITSTATSATDGTSEFSIATPVNMSSIQFDTTGSSVSEGGGNVSITVSRTNASLSAASVHYATSNGTATAGTDYTATTGDLNFAVGEASKTIVVPILNDNVAEATEQFTVTLSNATNGAILQAPTVHTVTVYDNDPEPTITIDDAPAVLEGNSGTTPATFTVTLSRSSIDTVTVHYATADNTTTAGVDYTPVAGTLTFASGETSKTITVSVIGDTQGETDETFRMILSNPTNASLSRNFGTGTILNDDGPPPTPSPSPTATATATPKPTSTPTPTPTPTATATSTPRSTPTPSATATSTPSPTPSPTPTPVSHLANISTRIKVQTGDNVLIAGFIIQGNSSKRLVVRGIGPSLPVTGPLPDPTLELHDSSGGLIASNDDWMQNTNAAEISASGVAPGNTKESAILISLAPGTYTAVLRGKNSGSGIGLVELYDLDANGAAKIVNISTRGFVLGGDSVMIGGLIITGTDSSKVLIRAIGPSLAQFGVPTVLADPILELHSGNGDVIFTNNNWRDTQATDIAATGLQPSDNLESAILISLAPGNYTAVVKGADAGTGNGLVEVYKVDP